MAFSKRRLATTPSHRTRTMPHLAGEIEAFLDHQRALGRSPATVGHYADSLHLLMRCCSESDIPLDQALTSETMTRFATWLRQTPTRVWRGKTERSIHGVHGALRDTKAMCRWLVEEGRLEHMPKVPIPRLPQQLFPVLSEEDLAAIFACHQLDLHTEIGLRNRALIAFMLDTGVRLSEVAHLQLHDLQLKSGAAKIYGKGSKERLVYFSEGVATAIRRWLDIRGLDDGPLFWLEPGGIRGLFGRIQAETGIMRLHPHVLRHTCFTLMVKQNADLHTIKRLAGHASVTTTESYLALSQEELRAKQNTASPFELIRAGIEPTTVRGRRRLKCS